MRVSDRRVRVAGAGAWLGVLAATLLVLGLGATPAFAGWEGVGYFGGTGKPVLEEKFTEEEQLGGARGVAVNVHGAGGVAPGTIYVATSWNSEVRVARYSPTAGAGMTFSESWTIQSQELPYERCGPEGDPAHPHCAPHAPGNSGTAPADVEVDQATGNVYVLGGFSTTVGGVDEVIEYAPDGSSVITRFAPDAALGEKLEESPEEFHGTQLGGMAISETGEVYVFDWPSSGYYRLLVYRPASLGDYSHYVYAGEDLATSKPGEVVPQRPVVDNAGHIYIAGEEDIEEFAAQVPAPYPALPASPVCRFHYAKGGIESMTVETDTGVVFFYSYKSPKRIRRLGPCNMETGAFTELSPEPESFEPHPERGDIYGMAFDPVRKAESSRPAGTLYAVTPNGKGESGSGEPSQGGLGYVFAQGKELSPTVTVEYASRVTSSGGVLRAKVNPEGFDTHYVFQYLTIGAYEANTPSERFAGATELPAGGGLVRAGDGASAVAASLSGLQPDTEYRFRVIVRSNCAPAVPSRVCEEVGEAKPFRTFPVQATALVDHRAYELVSPAVKNGQVLPAEAGINSCIGQGECKLGRKYGGYRAQSVPDGEAVLYEGTAFSPTEGLPLENEYVARRDPSSGWQTVNLTPSVLGTGSNFGGGGYRAFDRSLTTGVLKQLSPVLSASAPVDEEGEGYDDLYVQSVDDRGTFSPLLTEVPPSRPASGTGRFSVDYAGATPDLSSVFLEANDALTEATSVAPAAVDGGASANNLYEWSSLGLRLVNVLPGNANSEPGATFDGVSEDGSRVLWSSEAGQVYVRIDGQETKRVEDPGRYLDSSSDGQSALLNDGCLYVLAQEKCEDLTLDEANLHQGGFVGVVGQSDDLSRVYFVDKKTLTGQNPEHRSPNEHGGEENNVFLWEQGHGTTFVTTLPSGGAGEDWSASPGARRAEASPDGKWLSFVSYARLTGFDNTGPCFRNGVVLDAPCGEVFIYDATAGKVTCASCSRSDSRPLGSSYLRLSSTRYLTNTGRLLFDSQDSLVPADVNEGVEDVYEYEPDGVGTCTEEAGCVSLISAGTGSVDSNLLVMDETGKNVFFTTRDKLVPADRDEQIDLYDAREGGGLPADSGGRPSECQGEGCQAGLTMPGEPSPGSASLTGGGNAPPPPMASAKAKTLSRAQKLARALAACHKRHGRARAACERAARKHYGAKTAARGRRSRRGNANGKGGR